MLPSQPPSVEKGGGGRAHGGELKAPRTLKLLSPRCTVGAPFCENGTPASFLPRAPPQRRPSPPVAPPLGELHVQPLGAMTVCLLFVRGEEEREVGDDS